jgi:gamma-glutamylcysteine synthetase
MLEFHGMASAMLRMMEKQKEFSGTYSDLIGQLEMNIGPREKLPQTSHSFAAELRRIRPALERHGLRFYSAGRSSSPTQKGRSRISIVRVDEEDTVST